MIRLFVLISLLCLAAMTATAQSKAFEQLYERQSKIKGIESKSIGKLLLFAGRAVSNDIPEGLDGIKILSIKERNAVATITATSFERDIRQTISRLPSLRLIKDTVSNGHKVTLYGLPTKNGKYKDIILYITGSKTIMALEMAGEFDQNDLAKISARKR